MNQSGDSSLSSRGGTTGATAACILVVEDGLIMARDIERRLTTMGYRSAGVAATGEDAVRKARDNHPDLVLMDVNLKGPIDGIQAAQQIRLAADIPIVYVTGYSDDATLLRARVTEPFGFVLKPFDERELRTTIEIALYRHQVNRRLRESEQRYRAIVEQHAEAMKKEHLLVDQETRDQLHAYTCSLMDLLQIITDVKPRAASADSSALANRLRGIFDVYARVYRSKQPLEVEKHLHALTAELFKRHGRSRLTYKVDAEPCTLNSETAVGILLILRELLHNVVRHAYPDGARGDVTVELRQKGEGKVMLRVADGGTGLRKDVDPHRPKNVGFHFVNHLVRQLKGTLECKRESGTAIVVTFPSLP
jgi:two-component sensor histidine kinase